MSGILVDTYVWSIALRDSSVAETLMVKQLTRLIDDNQVKIIGAIRQELLSGYTDKSRYEKLRQKLRYFLKFTLPIKTLATTRSIYPSCSSR